MGEALAIISANLGDFEKELDDPLKQVMPRGLEEMSTFHFTDEDFPPRKNSMTPRLQSRIVKMFSWQFLPDYDYYLWVDSSCRLARSDSAAWFMSKLGQADVAVFKHPDRRSVQEEADYLKYRLSINCPYITSRYENELIDEQLVEVNPMQELYASTAFIYRNTPEVQEALKDWWYHTSRFHSIDQLSMPWVLRNLNVNVIRENYTKVSYLEYVRNKK